MKEQILKCIHLSEVKVIQKWLQEDTVGVPENIYSGYFIAPWKSNETNTTSYGEKLVPDQ